MLWFALPGGIAGVRPGVEEKTRNSNSGEGDARMALAPEQVGIGIRRHFTEPGVHPYDTVEWERRDAHIPNWKDGTDAFRQDGVEFPVTWSQNATNIVAQKYFRGTL